MANLKNLFNIPAVSWGASELVEDSPGFHFGDKSVHKRLRAAISSQPLPEALPPAALGVFNSGQAALMFPGASGLIMVVWKVLGKVFPSWGTVVTVPFILALLVGLSLYCVSESKGKTLSEKMVGFFFALLNSCTLAATALGIETVTK